MPAAHCDPEPGECKTHITMAGGGDGELVFLWLERARACLGFPEGGEMCRRKDASGSERGVHLGTGCGFHSFPAHHAFLVP